MGKCSQCHKEGHTIRTCKREDVEGVPLLLSTDVIERFHEIERICKDVSMNLKKGFSESVYESAVCIELQLRGIQYSTQEVIPITYKDRYVGQNRLDIILHSWLDVILELKATSTSIKPDERWQVVRYMNRKNYTYGVVINFQQSIHGDVEISYIVRNEDRYYIYNLETSYGISMMDF